MSVPVVCPGCKTRLTAPAELLGRKVKCPDCGLVLVVPAVAYPPPAPPPPRPSPQPRPRPAPPPRPMRPEFDDEPADYDRPRRGGSSGAGVLLLLGFLALLFVVGGGAAIWYFAIRESGGKDTGVVESPRPAGWERFSPAGGGFAVYVPDTPEELPEMEKELAGTGCTGEMYMVSDNSAKTVYVIGYITFPSSITRSDREKVANEMIKGFARGAGGAREIENKKVRMGGRDATEVVYEMTQGKGSGSARIVARVLVTGSNAYILIVGCENGRPKASDERGFFDSFELTSGAK